MPLPLGHYRPFISPSNTFHSQTLNIPSQRSSPAHPEVPPQSPGCPRSRFQLSFSCLCGCGCPLQENRFLSVARQQRAELLDERPRLPLPTLRLLPPHTRLSADRKSMPLGEPGVPSSEFRPEFLHLLRLVSARQPPSPGRHHR